jgi:chaperonin GroES
MKSEKWKGKFQLAMMDEASSPDTKDLGEGSENELTDKQMTDIGTALSYANLAKNLKKKDPDLLSKIGSEAVDGYENDDKSRSEWLRMNKEYMKLACQVMEKKSYPWDGAANIKFPLLTTAALQFSARAYSALLPSMDVVKAKVIGDDQDGKMTEVANKLSTHMSYVVMFEIEDWEEQMDKLCFILPIIGTMFKKIWFSNSTKTFCSELYSPKDVVVNYYTKKMCNASRITEVQYFTPNEIREKQLLGDWIEYDDPFGPGDGKDETLTGNLLHGLQPPEPDEDTPRKVLIQYKRIDLDDDDYKEPYIITVDYETQKVLSIVANFWPEGVQWKDKAKKQVARIVPAEWFVKYDFLPNPDGGFYGVGFGILLGGINEMINTISNQLIDSATLYNLQAGFIGRGLRDSKSKKIALAPGEWRWVNNPGKDLKENIFPLPVKEPSMTLFNLLGTLSTSGKEVASVAEIFTGKMPGQNTPASTTMASIEQGLKVFTSIYKRMYRSMAYEFGLVFQLLKRYAPTEPVTVVGQLGGMDQKYAVSRFDYQKGGDLKIIPAADENMVSETQKLLKIQGLYELVQLGTINKQEMTRQALLYQGQDNISKLMEIPPPQPPLEMQLEQMKLADKDKDRQIDMMKLQSEARERESAIVLNLAKAKSLGDEQGAMMLEMQLEKEKAQADIQTKWMDLLFKREEHKMDMQHEQQMHDMTMQTKKSENELNLALKSTMGAQDIQANHQKNQIQTQAMKEQSAVKVDSMKQQSDAKVSSMKKQQAAKPKGKND